MMAGRSIDSSHAIFVDQSIQSRGGCIRMGSQKRHSPRRSGGCGYTGVMDKPASGYSLYRQGSLAPLLNQATTVGWIEIGSTHHLGDLLLSGNGSHHEEQQGRRQQNSQPGIEGRGHGSIGHQTRVSGSEACCDTAGSTNHAAEDHR